MSDYLGIEPCAKPAPPPNKEAKQGSPDVCARPGYDIVTHCVEPKGHEGQHTYSPVPDGICQCGREWKPQR